MKVLRKYNQFRRDCTIDMECQGCGNKQTYDSAYEGRNFWDNVVPNFQCSKCGKSAKDLGAKNDFIETRYPE